ncbi:ATP-binding protein [Micromonospora aurantiaca]|uniref:ATP-binding protein n=1 Tax=Micromonospora aurantiaca (nom. illeg.) TaxID=47850 RepID=UPI00340ADA6E
MATFKARARAVDMLGRQQIAGIPTAINELFKNAHDAYAKNVTGDFFRAERLLVIRDDGVGMSPDDFVSKWLVVGTESKVQGGITPPTNEPERPVLGEKGIGRLAVAAAGPQVLVMSRSRAADVLTFALVNWTLFTASGIDLDEVQIPITQIPTGVVPDRSHLAGLVDQLQANVQALQESLSSTLYSTVMSELSVLRALDPGEIRKRFSGPSLIDGSGTEFWISPTDEMLAHDISGNPNDEFEPPPLLKMLIGFSDTMIPGNPPPPMNARFIDHRSPDNAVNVIGDSEFFTPDDFAIADHRISGMFDEYGQFSGTVSVYGSDAVHHRVSWPGSKGQKTSCGPFTLNLAYVQGKRSASRLSPEEFNRTTQKLIRVGGLYVYRDRVRILPYGNHDFDWLDIERERSKSASDYFWSYRRMFGVVGISSSENFQLQEKAGREGFRSNAAYREFRDLLQNFLVQTARDFFRQDSADDTWRTTKMELTRAEEARRRHDSQSRQRRLAFRKSLADKEAALNLGKPEQEAGELLSELEDELSNAVSDPDADRAAQRILAAESRAQRSISNLRAKYRLARPRGISLPSAVMQDFESYQHEYQLLEVNLLKVTRMEVERRSTAAARRLGSALDRRRRLEAGLERTFKEAQFALLQSERTTLDALDSLSNKVTQTIQTSRQVLESEIRLVSSSINSFRTDELTDQEITDLRRSLEDRITQAVDSEVAAMVRLHDRLDLLASDDWSAGKGDVVDVIGSLEQEVASLRDRADEDLDLAQLGLALQVINHEFSASIRSVRRNLQRLRTWADANKALRPVYSDLRASFEHLDAYLRLFTPLNKRLYRRGTVVKGGDVEQFILDLFQERISNENITFEVTDSFRQARVKAYPSTLYPVFVNLIDNSIFWLMTRPTPRVIRLNHTGTAWTVSDNGPGIATKDHNRVFELGFSRKPNGRGMGLHISRDVLRKEGWELELADSPLGGASFLLREPILDTEAGAEAAT